MVKINNWACILNLQVNLNLIFFSFHLKLFIVESIKFVVAGGGVFVKCGLSVYYFILFQSDICNFMHASGLRFNKKTFFKICFRQVYMY